MKQFMKVTALATLAGAAALSGEAMSQTYAELVRQAQERSQAQDWKAAGPLWERVAEINPTDAWIWYQLGTARLNAREYRKAIPALEKARELGAGSIRIRPTYDIARAYAFAGDKEKTLMWLERALDEGFRSREAIRTDEAFAFVREDARFKALTMEVDTKQMSRVEGWQFDLSFLATEVKRMHYDAPSRTVSQADFEKEIQSLSNDVEKLTDNQIIVGVMRVMATIGDGHTGCWPGTVSSWTEAAPLQFEIYPEGVYIIAADSSHADLLGAQVLRFGDHAAEKVIQELNPLLSRDNTQGLLRSGRDILRYPQAFNGLGLLPDSENLPLTIRDATGKQRKVTVATIPNNPDFNRITTLPNWVAVYEKTPGPTPLYLRDRRTFWWFEPLEDGKTVYCQFNSVSDGATESLSSFASRLFEYIDAHDVESLIIDMRWNNGGNSRLLPALVNGLIRSKVNRNGNLFAIVGRYTYSAAMNAATFIERNTNAIIVGEPTPSSPNFVGESNMVTLPYSRVVVSISDIFWQSSWPTDRRTWIPPFLYAPPSFEAYRSKRDPAMEAILEYQRDTSARVP